jgi:hypothetical protein
MIGRLDAALVFESERFSSRKFLAECRSFVRTRNGRTCAMAGTHDDRIMAMGIAMAVREELKESAGRKNRAE